MKRAKQRSPLTHGSSPMAVLGGESMVSSCRLPMTGSDTLCSVTFSNMPVSICSVRCEVASLRAARERVPR